LKLTVSLAMRASKPTHIVPCYSFGETHILDNVQLPRLQRFFMTHLKANILFFPYGQINIPGTAVPRPVPLTLCVGRPILVPRILEAQLVHVDALAELLHQRYYTELHRVFEDNKQDSLHPDETLSMQPAVPFLEPAEFQTKWHEVLSSSSATSGTSTTPFTPPPRSDCSTASSSSSLCKPDAPPPPPPPAKPSPLYLGGMLVFGVEDWLCTGFFWVTGFMLSGNYLTVIDIVEPVLGVSASSTYTSMWAHGFAAFILKSMIIWCPVFCVLNCYVYARVLVQNRVLGDETKSHED
jgi:hypothetical protein